MSALVSAFGFRIVEVPDLTDHACVVPSQGLVLIRAGITTSEREDVSLLLPSLLAAAEQPDQHRSPGR